MVLDHGSPNMVVAEYLTSGKIDDGTLRGDIRDVIADYGGSERLLSRQRRKR